jgi:hypothetical protein
MGKKRRNLGFPHFLGMPFVVKQNVPADPIAVSSLGPKTEMLSSDDVPDLIEEFGLVASDRDRYVLGHAPHSGNSSPQMQP